jgi:glycosyltransferase involved in cell wall biosynthesis
MAEGNEDIVFHGFSINPLPQVAIADVFVHPSHNEAFSLSLIEAAKLGLPIIACNVGGNPEIVADGQNGLLVPPQNPDALYRAMKQLATNRTLRLKMGAAGEEKYHEGFEFETIVKEKYLPLYEDQ